MSITGKERRANKSITYYYVQSTVPTNLVRRVFYFFKTWKVSDLLSSKFESFDVSEVSCEVFDWLASRSFVLILCGIRQLI